MLEIEIILLTNNCVIPFQGDYGLPIIEFNKLFATKSIAEHGLGFLINIYEIDDNHENIAKKSLVKTIVFDTGGPNLTFIHNLNIRGYQMYDIDMILLSHWHYDHTGAFYELLKRIEKEIPVYCHEHAKFERFFKRAKGIKDIDLKGKTRKEILPLLSTSKIVNQAPINQERVKKLNGKLIFNKNPEIIFDQGNLKLILLGEIERKYDKEKFGGFFSLQNGTLQEDTIKDDRCLIIEFKDRIILLNGCCHSGIMNTLDQVKKLSNKSITHIIGGFHMASATEERIQETIEFLKSFQELNEYLYLFPIHCTGAKFLQKLQLSQINKIKAHDLSVGTKFNFKDS